MYQFLGFIAKPLGYLLTGIYSVVGHYGFTLIIFTVIVRLCLFPLYASQIKSQIKMMDVQPKMQAIQKKYAHDREEQQKRLSQLYKEENYNPMKGCLPMIIQMPILFGLFALLRDPTMFLNTDSDTISNMLLAVHENFLWVPDLSTPDLWILPIVAGITQFLSFVVTQAQSKNQMQGGAAQMQSMMKMMKYFFPIMIMWIARSFPAGMAIYWIIGNIFTIFQTLTLKGWKNKLIKNKDKATGKK